MTGLKIGANFGLFLYGVFLNMMGPLLPAIIDDLELTLTEAGTMYSLRGFGIVTAVILLGIFSDVIGRQKFILLGCTVWAAGFFVFAGSNLTWLSLAIWLGIGLGFGTMDATINAVVAEISADKGSALNRLHFYFGIGAIVGPAFAQGLMAVISWRGVFVISGLMVTGFAVFMALQKFPAAQHRQLSPWVNLRRIWGIRMLMLGFIAFAYLGVGTSLMGWINAFILDKLAVSAWAASLVLLLYSSGLTVGRFYLSGVAEKISYDRLLFFAALSSTVALALSLLAPNIYGAGAAFFATGFLLAGILPTALAAANRDYPELAGTVTAWVFTFGALGRAVLPGIVGAAADYRSIPAALWLLVPVSLGMTAAARALTKSPGCKKRQNQQGT